MGIWIVEKRPEMLNYFRQNMYINHIPELIGLEFFLLSNGNDIFTTIGP